MLENLMAAITGWLGPAGPLLLVLGLGVLLIVVALPIMLRKPAEPFDRIRAEREGAKAKDQGRGDQVLRRGDAADKLQKFATFLEPQNAEEMSAARLKMLRAGYRAKNAVRLFHFAQLVLALGALAMGMIYAAIESAHSQLSTSFMASVTLLPAAVGYYLPIYWVSSRVQKRQTEIIQGFPDALDMMLVCVEAGQSLDQSILRVAKESRAGYPALAEEFEIVSQEVKAGRERVQVLKDMSERVQVPDVSSFVTTLVQSATFGTSIAEALRVYSAEMRDKRVMRAEEKANVLPTKLTLGTMLFTVPPLLIILIGPALHGIATQLGAQ